MKDLDKELVETLVAGLGKGGTLTASIVEEMDGGVIDDRPDKTWEEVKILGTDIRIGRFFDSFGDLNVYIDIPRIPRMYPHSYIHQTLMEAIDYNLTYHDDLIKANLIKHLK